jgi:hypothetical protein
MENSTSSETLSERMIAVNLQTEFHCTSLKMRRNCKITKKSAWRCWCYGMHRTIDDMNHFDFIAITDYDWIWEETMWIFILIIVSFNSAKKLKNRLKFNIMTLGTCDHSIFAQMLKMLKFAQCSCSLSRVFCFAHELEYSLSRANYDLSFSFCSAQWVWVWVFKPYFTHKVCHARVTFIKNLLE